MGQKMALKWVILGHFLDPILSAMAQCFGQKSGSKKWVKMDDPFFAIFCHFDPFFGKIPKMSLLLLIHH